MDTTKDTPFESQGELSPTTPEERELTMSLHPSSGISETEALIIARLKRREDLLHKIEVRKINQRAQLIREEIFARDAIRKKRDT